MIYRPDALCQKIFGFRASLWYMTSGKNFMVICLVVSEILGNGSLPPPPFPPPPMVVSCQKEQMQLTVKKDWFTKGT